MPKLPWQSHPTTQIVPCTVAEYEQARGQFMGSHLLDLFNHSPRSCQWKMQGLLQEASRPAYDLGRAIHCFILEGPTEFHQRHEIAEGPINEKTGKPFGRDSKAWQEWNEQLVAEGRQVINGEEFTKMAAMAESIAETDASQLLHIGLPEVTIRGELHGVRCQSRLDFFNQDAGWIVDLKTCEDLDRFSRDFSRFGYDRQLAFYRGMVQGLGLPVQPRVYVIAAEKSEPFRSHVFEVSPETLDLAAEQIQGSLLTYRQLVATIGFDRPWPRSLKFGRTVTQL
jgi:hypothetical protein